MRTLRSNCQGPLFLACLQSPSSPKCTRNMLSPRSLKIASYLSPHALYIVLSRALMFTILDVQAFPINVHLLAAEKAGFDSVNTKPSASLFVSTIPPILAERLKAASGVLALAGD